MSDTLNQEFLTAIQLLKNNGITFKKIADAIGIKVSKMNDIKGGRSSADIEILSKLYDEFPEAIPEKSILSVSRREEDEEETADLKAILKELKKNNTLLEKIYEDLQKGENRAETIDRLTKLLDQQMGEED